MGSLDKWELEPLLILLSIHVSLVSSSEKESKGAHHGGVVVHEKSSHGERRGTHTIKMSSFQPLYLLRVRL